MATGPLASMIFFIVNALGCTTTSASDTRVLRDLSPIFLPYININADDIALAVSPIHIPHDWLQVDSFPILTNLFHGFSNMIALVDDPSHVRLVEALITPIKLWPLSDLKYVKFPLLVMNCLKDCTSELASICLTTSKRIALLGRHMRVMPYCLIFLGFSFIEKVPKQIHYTIGAWWNFHHLFSR